MAELNENSRIALIYSITGNGKVFIGSTIQTKTERIASHKVSHKKWVERGRKGFHCPSFELMDDEDWEFEDLEWLISDAESTGLAKEVKSWISGTENCVNVVSEKEKLKTRAEKKAQWTVEKRAKLTPEEKEARKKQAKEYEAKKRAEMTPEEREAKNEARRAKEAEKRELIKLALTMKGK